MRAILLVSIIFATGCATVHSSNLAKQIRTQSSKGSGKHRKSDLVISGEEISAFSSRHFGFVNLTFENVTSEWVEVEDLRVSFGDKSKDKAVRIVAGKNLQVWAKAARQKSEIDRFNNRIAIVALTGVMAGLAATTGSKTLVDSAQLMGLTAWSAYEIDNRITELRQAGLFPNNHLLAGKFMVPPGLFAKKYIVLQTDGSGKAGFIDRIYIRYRTAAGQQKVELIFRKGYSQWQKVLEPVGELP